MGIEILKQLVDSLDMVDGLSKQAWTPSIECKNAEYLQFTQLGGHGYTKDRYFHFFGPAGPVEHSLNLWNDPRLWRDSFLSDMNWVSIGETAFGDQLCMRFDGRRPVVKMMCVSDGDFALVGNSLSQFVEDFVLNQHNWRESREWCAELMAGFGREWRPYHHISSTIPPLLNSGSEEQYELTRSSVNIALLAQVFRQVRDLPAGTRISKVKLKRR